MYVREKKRHSKFWGCTVFQFSVVESYRQDTKVKQRVVCFLGWLPEKYMMAKYLIEPFWEKVYSKLKLFDKAERERLLNSLEKRIKSKML
jgi:hypothetical protein